MNHTIKTTSIHIRAFLSYRMSTTYPSATIIVWKMPRSMNIWTHLLTLVKRQMFTYLLKVNFDYFFLTKYFDLMIFFFGFVADPQHPIVKVDNPFLNGAQYQDIIIPCKPTSKMWDIQLIKEGDEVKSKMPLSVVTGEYFRSVCIQSHMLRIIWLMTTAHVVWVCHHCCCSSSSSSSSPKCLNILSWMCLNKIHLSFTCCVISNT